jgi:hypothetical protein
VSFTAQPVINNCIDLNPSVIITSPINGASFTPPATISITANASDADGSISKVEFYTGNTKLGEKSSVPYTFTWTNVAVGAYSLTAAATDNQGAKTTSPVISISVNNGTLPLNKPPTVNITSPLNNYSYSAPATIFINANASDSDGSISKVEFFNGPTKLGEITIAPYIYTWINVNPGTYYLTARATDNSNATTTSSSVEVIVTTTSEANNDLINLFPNPNTGNFEIDIITPLKNESNRISITNFEGEKVYEGILRKEELSKQFDLSYLNSGIYILMIIGNEILVTKKFIKN